MTTPPPHERMRVFSFEPLGGFGGMDVYDRSFHESLVREGSLDVTWVTGDQNSGDGLAYETWTPFRRVFGTGSLAAQGLRYARGLAALVGRAAREARRQPTVIHQQFLTVPALELAAMEAARRRGVPWIVTPHEVLPYSGARRDAFVRRRLFARAAALVALSRANMGELAAFARVPLHRIALTPHGHLNDYRGEDATLERDVARTRLGLDAAAPTILFLGELRPVKGLDHLLRAMPSVLRALRDVRLVVAGRPYRFDPEGPRRLIDTLGIARAVTARWSFVPDSELAAYLRAADVVALPYLAASQSGACFTAYAYRRTVVASAVGGLSEQVEDGVTGLLVPPANADALAAALIRLLRDPAEARCMGERAHAWAQRERSWDPIARRLAEVYWEAWGSRSGSLRAG